MKLNNKKGDPIYAAWALTVAVLILFIALPLITVFISANKNDFVSVATSKVWRGAILNTFLECICSSSLSVLVGFIYAYAIVKSDIPGKRFFRLVPIVHLVTPPFVGGLSFILLLGRQGFITHRLLKLDVSIYGFWGLLIAQTLCFFPMAYLICLQTLEGINANLEQAAKTLGAGNFKIFWTVTVPLSATGIISAFLFVAVSVLSDFGNPLIVAGRFRVLAVEIYTQLTGWLNVGTSAVLGIILVIPSVFLFVLQNRLIKKNNGKLSTIGGKTNSFGDGSSNKNCSTAANIFLFIFVLAITTIILAQFISIIAGSFQKLWGINESFTFEHLKAAFHYVNELRNSVLFALVSAVISSLIAIFSSYIVYRTNLPLRKTIEILAQLPSAIPGSLLGLAISILANKINFRGSAFLIVVAMVISFLPFAYKSVAANLSQIQFTLDDGARSLGANRMYLLRTVLIPVSSSSIFSGYMYSFIRGIGTVSAVIFLVSFNTPLASVRILNLAEQAFWGRAASLALILTVITFAVLGIGMIFTKTLSGAKKWKSR